MKRLTLAILLLAQTGRLSQLTNRLDRANEHLEAIQVQLKVGNERVAESSEALRRMELQLEDANRKMERLLKRLGAADADSPEAPASQRQ
jgi:hypothetical protein